MSEFTIGEVARRAGMGVETIRFYERKGLIADPPRRASGYRRYSRESVRRLLFIKHAKDLGFSLREIHELLELRVDDTTTCADVRARLEVKITDVGDRIRALERIRDALVRWAETCAEEAPSHACPLLEALDQTADPDDVQPHRQSGGAPCPSKPRPN